MAGTAVCRASPSLALIKYWGKRSVRRNTAATTSLAVSLAELVTETRVTTVEDEDVVVVGGERQDPSRYSAFFENLRRVTGVRHRFLAESHNGFPTSAGLASSSSGFAALAWACTRAAGLDLPAERVSELARVGSASAARAVFGGWVSLPAGASAARRLYGPAHWPAIRILVVTVKPAAKEVPSRRAMELVRATSPFYRSWVRDSGALAAEAEAALAARDLARLGETMRASTYRMFATMLAARPPVLYWEPDTLRLLHQCARLRAEGIGAWETMDAGPQVKIFCLASDLERVVSSVKSLSDSWRIIGSRVGGDPVCRLEATGGG